MIIGLSPFQIFQMTKQILNNNIIMIKNLKEKMLSCYICVFSLKWNSHQKPTKALFATEKKVFRQLMLVAAILKVPLSS